MPKLETRKQDKEYIIVDVLTEGSCYGRYATRKEAEESLRDWIEYFEN